MTHDVRAGLADDLLGGGDSFLLFALGQMGSALTRFINHPLPVGIGLSDNFLVTLLRFSEFLLDFLGINLAFLDLAPALRERVADIDYVDLRFGERLYVRPVKK